MSTANANSESEKIVNNPNANCKKQLDIRLVDELADELCREYSNPTYRKWYCKIIYSLGLERVSEIRGRCSDAKYPGRLFSKLINAELQRETVRKFRSNG